MADFEACGTGTFEKTRVNRVKRTPDRGRYDKKTIYEILDAALVCHISYVIGGRPYCTPTSFWREGDHLYWHDSHAGAGRTGLPDCYAYRCARDGPLRLHHSVNYRAAMGYGTAHIIADPAEKLRLMDNFVDRIYPGRSKIIRQPNPQEFKATTMIGMEIETASAKIRDKHVADEEEDYAEVPAWPALYPITQVLGEPSECPRATGRDPARRDGRLRARHTLRRIHDEDVSPDVWLIVVVNMAGSRSGTEKCRRFGTRPASASPSLFR